MENEKFINTYFDSIDALKLYEYENVLRKHTTQSKQKKMFSSHYLNNNSKKKIAS